MAQQAPKNAARSEKAEAKGAAAPVAAPRFVVAPGRSVAAPEGVYMPGDPVDMPEDEERLLSLGFLVDAREFPAAGAALLSSAEGPRLRVA